MAVSVRTNWVVEITWRDEEAKTPIDLTRIEACRVSIFDVDSETHVRRSENYLDDEHADLITFPANGKMKVYLDIHDTDMVGDYEVGDSQARSLYVRIGWGSNSSTELTNPFETTNNSSEVVVNHTAHGLAVKDPVFFETDTNVGGLDLADMWKVAEVLDADSYKIVHRAKASSTATGGGTVTAWLKGKSASKKVSYSVVADDPI